MKGRLAFLCFAGLLAALISGELYVSMRENAADEEVRKLNAVPDGEEWAISGSFSEDPASRFAAQGPFAAPGAFFEPDAVLGYRLRPNLRAAPSRARKGGRPLYDATQNTERFGWRVTPQVPNAPDDVLFLGDSFGITVNDAETLPARFSASFGGKALARNFGVPGWGPRQYLRLLEAGGEADEVEHARVTKVFYLAGPGQVARAYLADPSASLRTGLCALSSLCGWVKARTDRNSLPKAGSITEFVSTLQKIANVVRSRYGAGLTVVVWDPSGPADDAVKALRAAGLDAVAARDALSGAPAVETEIGNGDREPDARSLTALGAYLAQRLGR